MTDFMLLGAYPHIPLSNHTVPLLLSVASLIYIYYRHAVQEREVALEYHHQCKYDHRFHYKRRYLSFQMTFTSIHSTTRAQLTGIACSV